MWKSAARITWEQLNKKLKNCATIEAAQDIRDFVVQNNGPESFIKRIDCRIRVLGRKK